MNIAEYNKRRLYKANKNPIPKRAACCVKKFALFSEWFDKEFDLKHIKRARVPPIPPLRIFYE